MKTGFCSQAAAAVILLLAAAGAGLAQSAAANGLDLSSAQRSVYGGGGVNGSLYHVQPSEPLRVRGRIVNPQLTQVSLTAVPGEDARAYKVHDHVTIIIREQSDASSRSQLDTEKELKLDSKVQAFPHLTLKSLLDGNIRQSERSAAEYPAVKVSSTTEFESEGQYMRRDSMATRLTARVIDIKPNGALVLEGRTFIQNDDEKQEITITGTCMPDVVAVDNTVLSTQLFDLRVSKTHAGELRSATQKGLFTRVLEMIFNF